MRSRIVRRRQRRLLDAIIIAGSMLVAHAACAQSDGDERCNKKGVMWMFDALSKSWTQSGASCTPPGPDGPPDGAKRCGYAGYILKYDAKRGVWRASQTHCNGADSYIGWTPLK